ncbi:hypothetical protein HDV64DRAFT_136724 [Trichoderma sp. TUCIM 5745]
MRTTTTDALTPCKATKSGSLGDFVELFFFSYLSLISFLINKTLSFNHHTLQSYSLFTLERNTFGAQSLVFIFLPVPTCSRYFLQPLLVLFKNECNRIVPHHPPASIRRVNRASY